MTPAPSARAEAERLPGWYWVRLDPRADRVIAEWDGDSWWLVGNSIDQLDSIFSEIGPRIPSPEEAARPAPSAAIGAP